jgi:hypothetical protein
VAAQAEADLVLYTQDEMHIIDTKWGKIPVSVFGNAQLKYYAATYGILAPKAKGITVHILQPNVDNMEWVWLSADDIKAFMDDAIATQNAIEQGDVTFGPGDHCTFCPANPHSRGVKGKPLCPAMMGLLYPGKMDEAAMLDGIV